MLWVRCGVETQTSAQQTSPNGFALPEKYFAPPPIKKGCTAEALALTREVRQKGSQMLLVVF
jgi:hypothetical protein